MTGPFAVDDPMAGPFAIDDPMANPVAVDDPMAGSGRPAKRDEPPGEGFRDRVAAAVAAIPPGTVATYGEVAVEAGFAVGASRAVGNVLQQVERLPWWRVVTASGRLVPGLEERHASLLTAEGVVVEGGRVRLRRAPVRSAEPGSRKHR